MNRIVKFILTVFIICLGSLVSAQDYVVKSFEIIPDDIDARVNSRVGANGRKCALLKVYVKDGINHVNGSVVGDVETKGMEKWIYLAHDSKQVELVFENHYPLRIKFDDYNIPVVTEQTVYVIKLGYAQSSDSDSGPIEIQSQSQKKLIYSSGNKVFQCDGKYRADFDDCRANEDRLFEVNLGTFLNRKHFSLSLDYYPDEDMRMDRGYNTQNWNAQNWVLTLSRSYRVLGFRLENNGEITITTDNQDHVYKTPLTYDIDSWNSISIEYNQGTLIVNGYKITNVKLNPIDGRNELSNTNYSNGGTFKGRIANVRVYSYDDDNPNLEMTK